MGNNKIIGIALLITGVALLFWGYDIYDSVGSQLGRAFGGDGPMKAYAMLIGGVICVALGIKIIK